MKRSVRGLCALLICFGCLWAYPLSATAQIVPTLPATVPSTRATTRPTPPVGDYAGALKVGAFSLRLGLKVEKAGDGFTGVLDSIDQGAKLPIDRIEFAGGKLKLTIAKIGGGYEGTFAPDGESIDGKWTQGGQTMPLTFKRVTEALSLKRPQEPKPPLPYKEEKVTVDNAAAKVKLAGTLTLPKTGGPFPAVLLITGSGPQDRDETVMGHRPFLILADHLTRQGVAVLRLDDRGVGASSGDFTSAATDDFVSDAQAALAFLRARKDIDPQRVGLLGHSEGGVTGPLVAVKDPAVAFVVLLAAPGVPMETLLLRQSQDVARQSGADAAKLQTIDQANRKIYAILKTVNDPTEIERQIRAQLDESLAELPPAERDATKNAATAQVKMMTSAWFRQLLKYDPAATLSKINCPVLALWGERDVQVSAKENLAGAAAAMKANHDVTTAELPGLNHLLQTCTTGALWEYSTIEETMSPAALKQIGDWVRVHTKVSP